MKKHNEVVGKHAKTEGAAPMQLVEQHIIGKHDPRYSMIDEAAFNLMHLQREQRPM